MLKCNFGLSPAVFIAFTASGFSPSVFIPRFVFTAQLFLFPGNSEGGSSAEVVGMEGVRCAPETFRNGLRRPAFSHLPNACGDILQVFFFCTTSKITLYLWAGVGKLRRSPGQHTRTPRRAHSSRTSGSGRLFPVSLSPSAEGKRSI